MSPKIKVLIVGAGRIAGLNELDVERKTPSSHAGAYIDNKKFLLVGVVDKDINVAKKFASIFKIPFASDNLSESLAFTKPDLLSITVPYQIHDKILNECIQSNYKPRFIFCEKPLKN